MSGATKSSFSVRFSMKKTSSYWDIHGYPHNLLGNLQKRSRNINIWQCVKTLYPWWTSK
jgi:hypothetical protein